MVDAGELVKKIQEMREGGYLQDAILRAAVRKIKESDDRFNWVGVYLLDAQDNVLWLQNYMGQPTEHARIPVGTGVCGTAVAEGKNQNIPDVSKVENYLTCSVRTKSELVILIRAGEEVLGQIDIDSFKAAAFRKEDEETLELVAEKLAEVIMAERY